MDTPIPTPPASDTLREGARAARKRWQAEKIEHAVGKAAAGHYITGDEPDRWLDRYEASDDPVSMPRRAPAGEAD